MSLGRWAKARAEKRAQEDKKYGKAEQMTMTPLGNEWLYELRSLKIYIQGSMFYDRIVCVGGGGKSKTKMRRY